MKNALKHVAFWISIAIVFNLCILVFLGRQHALEFLGGYVIELSLSVDNLFLFLMIFSKLRIPPIFQRRVLDYGIAGAIVLRLLFIFAGIAVVQRFHWILYLFGIILMYNGISMMVDRSIDNNKNKNGNGNSSLKQSWAASLVGKLFPISDTLENQHFFVRHNQRLYATPLLVALVMIESMDIIFAVDSIPAIFSITTDPFLVYSSNIFAIIGLRSMYFVLNGLQERFSHVRQGVALILIFTGFKLTTAMFGLDLPIVLSLLVIIGILFLSIIVSLWADRR